MERSDVDTLSLLKAEIERLWTEFFSQMRRASSTSMRFENIAKAYESWYDTVFRFVSTQFAGNTLLLSRLDGDARRCLAKPFELGCQHEFTKCLEYQLELANASAKASSNVQPFSKDVLWTLIRSGNANVKIARWQLLVGILGVSVSIILVVLEILRLLIK